MASIYNSKSNTLLSGTSGNDTIQNGYHDKNNKWHDSGSNVTIKGGAGNDTIENSGDYAKINAGTGDDFIDNLGNYVTLDAGTGNDEIYNFNLSSMINGGAGNDSIYNSGRYAIITGGAGNDSISNYGGFNVTINAGAGSDFVSLNSFAKNNVIQYSEGDGNDTIYGFNASVTLRITNGGYTTTKSGSDVIITVDDGSITLKDVLADNYNKITIKDSKNKIFVYNDWKIRYGNVNRNYAGNVTLGGSKNADIMVNIADNVLITGKAGNDSIRNYYGSNVTIDAGAGNDSIYNDYDSNVTIDGGAGDDYISNDGDKVTIDGGAGNDYIWNSGDKVTINAGAGDDSIHNYCGYYAKIKAGAGSDSITNFDRNVTINAGAGNDFIWSSGNDVVIDGSLGNDTLYNNWIVTSDKVWGSDSTYGSNVVFKYSSGCGNDIIYGFNSDDTLQIAGSYTTAMSGSDMVVKVDDGSITLKNTSTVNIVTIQGGEISETNTWKVSDTTATYGTSSKTLITVTGLKSGTSTSNISLSGKTVTLKAAALSTRKVTISGDYKLALADDVTKSKSINKSWTLSNGTAIYKSGGTTAGYKLASNEKSISYYSASGNSTLATITGIKSKSGISVNNKTVTVKSSSIADGKTVSVIGSDYKFKLNGTSGKNTLQGGVGNDTLTGGGGADLFIHIGGNDIITDYAAQDKIKISANYESTISGNDIILTTSKGTLTIKNSVDKSITINGETKNFSDDDNDLPTGLSYSDDEFTLIVGNNFTDGKIDLSKYANVINVNANDYTRMDLKITGNNYNNNLVGGSGADTINGGKGSDYLTGGNGMDIFIYNGGNDIITDYRSSEDKIKLSNTKIEDIKVGDDDIIFTTSTGTLKIVNGKGKQITIIDSTGEHSETYANIAEILADNSVGEFEFENKITAQENLITFAK